MCHRSRWRCGTCRKKVDEVADIGWISGYPFWACRRCIVQLDAFETPGVAVTPGVMLVFRKRHACSTCDGEGRLRVDSIYYKTCDDCKDNHENPFR